MNKEQIKIVADSSSDIFSMPNVPFASAPLKIITSAREYVDDDALDVGGMVDDLAHYKGRSYTSCPNADDYLSAFGDAKYVFCMTITAALSGSYAAAMIAKETYEEAHPDRRVCVINSLSTGPEIMLLAEKIEELALADKDFDTVCLEIKRYAAKTGLLFMLESMKNLANNGRVKPLVAKLAGFLNIRLVGKASDAGELEPLCKPRGLKASLEALFDQMKKLGYRGGKVRIAHCFNQEAAGGLLTLLHKEYPEAETRVYPSRGLCSFYAEKGGLLVGFEKA